ncbi:MAG TPA: hypothetical protein VFT87_05580 [Candidatus Saccharimonadales bacterium]|nr:hypothetical protein [Candidatus Saccharimonadales bacterium]
MHKSATPISKWILAHYLIATNPRMTVEKLQEYIGVTYKTAWRMREMIKEDLAKYMPYYRQSPERHDN